MDENTGIEQGKANTEPAGLDANDPKRIPVIEEQLHIGKKVVETGRVHVSKKVTEQEFNAEMPVFKEEVIVERKAIGQYIEGNVPGIRLDGDTTIIPVIKEVIVKRILLVEELYITRRKVETNVPIHETLRREEVVITRSGGQIPESL